MSWPSPTHLRRITQTTPYRSPKFISNEHADISHKIKPYNRALNIRHCERFIWQTEHILVHCRFHATLLSDACEISSGGRCSWNGNKVISNSSLFIHTSQTHRVQTLSYRREFDKCCILNRSEALAASCCPVDVRRVNSTCLPIVCIRLYFNDTVWCLLQWLHDAGFLFPSTSVLCTIALL